VIERQAAKKARKYACCAIDRMKTVIQLICSLLTVRELGILNARLGVGEHDVWSTLFLASVTLFTGYYTVMSDCLALDAFYLDIPDNEEQGGRHTPMQHKRIDDFPTDDHAYQWTNFNRSELHEIIRLWDLPEQILVPRSGTTAHYVFNNQELVIFFLNAMKSGERKADICSMKIGGDDGRWGVGYNWLIRYLDARYAHLVGPESLALWLDQIPYFARKMGEAAAKEHFQRDEDGTVLQYLPGLDIDPNDFGPFALIDCNETRICRPGSGPAGDWLDAPRKDGWYEMQRAFFGGHHKEHALKTMTVILPNGIEAALFGPVSVRR
jgi:hypothetical protein